MPCHGEKDLTCTRYDSYKYFPLSFKPKLYLGNIVSKKIDNTEKTKQVATS